MLHCIFYQMNQFVGYAHEYHNNLLLNLCNLLSHDVMNRSTKYVYFEITFIYLSISSSYGGIFFRNFHKILNFHKTLKSSFLGPKIVPVQKN